jgi:thiol-disulfide isomerase/thioredoxin
MLNDSAIIFNRMADTVINNTDCIAFDIIMPGKQIDMFGNIIQKENDERYYSLFLNKKDLLPKQFISFFEKNSPIWIVTYKIINPLKSVNDSIFDYSLHKPDYKKYTSEEFQIFAKNENILKSKSFLGVKALDWTLPSMTEDSVTLSKIDANLVMLEFWFPHCTGCVLAIPEINEIQKKYKNKGLKIFGIEFTKSDSIGLPNYINRSGIEYPTLYSAKEVAKNYGVSAGPSLFLIKDGKFVYARTGFIKDELINEIEKNLE